jgi:uncharacterized membrane protein YfcA
MTEEVVRWTVLVGSAFVAGVLNSIAGGGTLLTFPALLAFGIVPGGMPAVQANATSTVALVPGSIAGAWGYRRHLADAGPWLWLLLAPSVVGGAIGTLLVTRLDPNIFGVLVPWLLLTATVLFLLQPVFRRFIPPRDEGLPAWPARVALVLFQLLVAVYGGYFGAGIGILMLSSLGLMGIGDIHRMNAVKTVLAAAINVVSVAVFVFYDTVVWSPALVMMVGSIAGGYAGASVGQRLPREVVRWIVIILGLGLTVWYFARPVA